MHFYKYLNKYVSNLINSTFMSIVDIYSTIDNMQEFPYDVMYNILIETYSKTKVEFIMYDRFKYKVLKKEQRERDKIQNIKNMS